MWLCFVVLAIICLTAVNGVLRASPSLAGAALPANLTANIVFQPALERMWQLSPTFRRRCRRLSAAPQLHLNLLLEELARHPSSYRARSVMRYENGTLVSVDMHLRPLEDPVELIAHEIEHVIEQLDQVDLQAHASGGTVWKREDGAFETRRAIAVGRRVADEVTDTAQAAIPHNPQEESARHPVPAITLQDRFPALSGPPSGRVSASGRHVAFASYAALLPADGNTSRDVYVMNVSTRRVTLETPAAGGRAADGESLHPDISRDGRFVVFESSAGNLTNVGFARGIPRVFLRDRQTGTTRLLSTNTRGEPANGPSMDPAISADGEAVVFTSSAGDILGDGTTIGGGTGVYLIRLATNERTRVDLAGDEQVRAGQAAFPAISADGRHVAFMSRADLTLRDGSSGDQAPDDNRVFDIYVRDTVKRHTTRVSHGRAGRDSNGPSYHPAISGNGRFVAFASEASNLTPDGSARVAQIYVRDMEAGRTEMISHTPAGRPADAGSARPVVSGDGSVVAYQSLASNLLCDDKCDPSESDINLLWDVYVYDRSDRRTIRASRDEREEWMEVSRGPSLDETGRLLAFASLHPGSAQDEGNDEDLFLVDLSREERPHLPEILDQHQIGGRRVAMDQDRLSVGRHGQAVWLEGRLDTSEDSHSSRRGVEHLNRNLRAWRPRLNEAIGWIPSPTVAAGAVVHAGVDDSPALESYATHDLTRCPPGKRNGQEWPVSERWIGRPIREFIDDTALIDERLPIDRLEHDGAAATLRHARGRPTLGRDLPGVAPAPESAAVAIRKKVDPPSIARPHRRIFVARICRDPAWNAAAGGNDPDVGAGVGAGRFEGNVASVWRPCRQGLTRPWAVRQLLRARTVGRCQPDLFHVAGADGAEGDAVAVWRELRIVIPCRGHEHRLGLSLGSQFVNAEPLRRALERQAIACRRDRRLPRLVAGHLESLLLGAGIDRHPKELPTSPRIRVVDDRRAIATPGDRPILARVCERPRWSRRSVVRA